MDPKGYEPVGKIPEKVPNSDLSERRILRGSRGKGKCDRERRISGAGGGT